MARGTRPPTSGQYPVSRFTASASRWMSRPATRTRPFDGGITPASTRIVVDLPAPLRPSRAVAAPGATWRSIPRTASTEPNETHRDWTSTTGAGVVGSGAAVTGPLFPGCPS